MTRKLGRLKKVNLREFWKKEDKHFTPWLAEEENIAFLAEALNFEELTVEAQEKSVGVFWADILCKDEMGNWVVIENQLDESDHKHLGQIMTYASGLKAETVVWISDKFKEEHRAALDWLNDKTDETVNFFGLEIELWRIGESELAPKFNIVCKPNDWSRSVSRAKRDIGLSDTKRSQLKFWISYKEHLQQIDFPLSVRSPRAQHWLSFAIGRPGCHIAALQSIRDQWIGVELVFTDDNAKPHYYQLEKSREEIESELGYSVTWLENPDYKRSKVENKMENGDPGDDEKWDGHFEWLAEKLADFAKVFKPRILKLDANEYSEEEA